MDNKIKLEDTCLKVEQAKELQALGVDMSDSMMAYCDYYDQVHDYELLMNNNLSTSYAYEVVNTLTNTEMLEMLPEKYIYSYSKSENEEKRTIICRKWANDSGGPTFCNKLMRDSLFEIIKSLKTNKLM